MTHRAELEKLKTQLIEMGYRCNFIIGEEGYIDQVFWNERLWNPLSFAEKVRPIVARSQDETRP